MTTGTVTATRLLDRARCVVLKCGRCDEQSDALRAVKIGRVEMKLRVLFVVVVGGAGLVFHLK